jgi:chemotaxis signal transduction protein
MTANTGVFVRVEVGTEVYAIPVEHVTEVDHVGEVTAVAGTSPAVVGVRNLRGTIIPVFRLATLLGLPSTEGGSRMVITEHGGMSAALAVDRVTDVGGLPEATEETGSDLLAGAAIDGGRLVGVVDVERLFASLVKGTS